MIRELSTANTSHSLATLAIRADASPRIGVGHAMRCLALAQRWRDLGGDVVLLTAECPASILRRFRDEGCRCQKLPIERPGDATDIDQTLEACTASAVDWIVLDGYAFQMDFQQELRQAGHRVLALDDFGHCNRWAAQFVLNQNLNRQRPSYLVEHADDQQLVGSPFALLRREFLRKATSTRRSAGGTLEKLFVTFGGADPARATEAVLDRLRSLDSRPLQIRVAVGAANPRLEELRQAGEASCHHVELLEDIRDMPSMYAWADGVICAAGSSCWEWMLFRLPAFIVPIADNQQGIYCELTRRNWAVGVPDANGLRDGSCESSLLAFLQGDHFLQLDDSQPIDGWGAARVCAAMTKQPWLRPATGDDCRLYFDWANEADVRRNSIQTDPIRWEDHQRWFTKRLSNDDCHLLLGLDHHDRPVGQVRFEKTTEGTMEINFSVDASCRGKGMGRTLLELALRDLRQKTDMPISAKVKRNNFASLRLFHRLPFEMAAGPDPDLVYFRCSPDRSVAA